MSLFLQSQVEAPLLLRCGRGWRAQRDGEGLCRRSTVMLSGIYRFPHIARKRDRADARER